MGAPSFLTFLGLFPSLVALDRTVTPPAVDLQEASDEQAVAALRAVVPAPTARSAPLRQPSERPPAGTVWKIRSDLWSAVLDYSSNAVWVWDGQQAIALPDDTDVAKEAHARLPTVTEQILQDWRGQFVTAQVPERPAMEEELHRWRTDAGSSWSLPPQVRYQWFETLKLHVRDRLIEWFDEHHLPLPDDFVETQTSSKRSHHGRDPGTEQLRALVVRCVEGMTREELEAMRLPPVALLRTRLVR